MPDSLAGSRRLRRCNAPHMEIETECSSCGGRGVYCGFAEPRGTGVVCLNCEGTGCRKVKYTPFTARKRREGVEIVRRSKGGFIGTGVGPTGASVTYEEFLGGKMP